MANDTAVVLIDPYNDFLHKDGKLYASVADSLQQTDTIANLLKLVKAARANKIPIFYGLHQQWSETIFKQWQMMSKAQEAMNEHHVFEEGSWGVKFFEGMEPDPENGDVIVSKHWNSSSFHNTDLDYRLRQRGIRNVVLAGLSAETCFESTARFAYELGYNLTLLSDATAGFNQAAKEAACRMIWPLFANNITTVDVWAEKIASHGSGGHQA